MPPDSRIAVGGVPFRLDAYALNEESSLRGLSLLPPHRSLRPVLLPLTRVSDPSSSLRVHCPTPPALGEVPATPPGAQPPRRVPGSRFCSYAVWGCLASFVAAAACLVNQMVIKSRPSSQLSKGLPTELRLEFKLEYIPSMAQAAFRKKSSFLTWPHRSLLINLDNLPSLSVICALSPNSSWAWTLLNSPSLI